MFLHILGFIVLLCDISIIIIIPSVTVPAMTNYQVVQRVPTGYRMPCPPQCPKGMYEIMSDCWKDNENDRPTFETLQWKLEDFFDLDVTSYDDANRY